MINTTGTVVGVENLPIFVSEIPAARPVLVPLANSAPSESEPAIGLEPRQSIVEMEVEEQKDAGLWQSTVDDFQLFNFIDERLAAGSTNIYAEALEQMERRLFAKVLDVTNGNQSKTAEVLGITRGKVRDRIAAFGILLERTVFVGKQ